MSARGEESEPKDLTGGKTSGLHGPNRTDRRRIPSSHEASPETWDGIKAADRLLDEKVRRGDASDVAESCSEETQVFAMGHPPIIGLDDALDFWQSLMDAGTAGIKHEIDELYKLGDLLYEIGRFAVTNDNGKTIVKGNYITVWRREDGRWKVFRDISTIKGFQRRSHHETTSHRYFHSGYGGRSAVLSRSRCGG